MTPELIAALFGAALDRLVLWLLGHGLDQPEPEILQHVSATTASKARIQRDRAKAQAAFRGGP